MSTIPFTAAAVRAARLPRLARTRVRGVAAVAAVATAFGGATFGGFSATTSNDGNNFTAGTWGSADVVMDDPGAVLTGSVGLTATATTTDGSSIASVTIQRSPAGSSTWTDVCTDTTSPYSCTFSSGGVGDGLYDFRATATTSAGSTGTSATVTNRRIDNTAPSVTMTDPGAWFGRTPTLSSTTSDGAGTGVSSVRYQYKLWSAGTWTDACTGSSAPFSCSFNASLLTEGEYYDFRAIATDGVNLSTTSATIATRRLDKTLPAATMNDPGANLRGTASLGASGSDTGGSGLASVTIQRSPAGASAWTDVCTDATWPYSCSLNTTTLDDGLYDFRAVSRDGAGNQTASAVVANRRVDNTPPEASVNDPGPYVRGTFTLTAAVSDTGSGVGSVQFQYKTSAGSTWTNICTADTTSPYSCAIDGSGASGSYDFRVVATDVAGNQRTSAAITTIIDNSVPTVAMGDPGANLRGSVSLTASASDNNVVASVKFQHRPSSGSTWTDACTATSSPYSCPLDTTTLTDGLYDFRAVATDGAGNTTTSAGVTSRRIDNTGPSVAMADPGEWFSATKTLSSTTSDAGSGVALVRYRYKLWSDVFWTDACTSTSSPYSCSFDPSLLTDGATYDFHAVATDVVGNETTSALWTRTVRFDSQAPTGVTMENPGTPLTGSVTLSGDAADAPSGIKSLTFQVAPTGTTNWTTACADTTFPYSCSFNTATVGDGSYDMRVVAEDQAGNTTPSSVHTSRMIDNNAPAVTMTDPGANLRQSVTLSATASDTNGIGSIVIQRSAAGANTWIDVCTDTTSPYSCSLDTTTVSDGLYDFRAVATDGSGRTGTSAVVASRRVDNAAPSVTMTDPGTYVRATVTVSATASDGGSGVATVVIQRSPTGANTWTEICTDSTSPYSCSWNTTGVAGGQYDLRAVATDVVGNDATSALVTTTVDNTAPTGTNIQTANGGATPGKAEQGDSITFTYSEEMSASSILAGWDGTSTAVTLRLNDATTDTLTVYNSADTARVDLTYVFASLALNGNYVPTGGAKFNATMVKSGAAITVTLGTLRSGAVNSTAAAAAAMSWRPSSASDDLAGNACSTTAVAESGASDAEF